MGPKKVKPFPKIQPLNLKPTVRQKEKLATQFDCLFCNHEKSVDVKLDKKLGVGNLTCKVCGQSFQATINCKIPRIRPTELHIASDNSTDLSAQVDVYADWMDACDAVAKESSGKAKAARGSNVASKPTAIAEEGDDFIVDDELDAEGEYADE